MKNMNKTLIFILSILIAYFIFVFIIFLFQNSLIYFPTSQDFNSCSAFSDLKKVNIGETRLYYDEIKDSRNLVVFYHGNGGSACGRAFLLPIFREANVSSVFVEYSGYSNDPKRPTKKRILQNIEDTNKFISNLDYSELTLIGESLGTGLVSEHLSLNKPDRVILISPYTSTLTCSTIPGLARPVLTLAKSASNK